MPALLLSGERSNLTVVEFDTDSHKLAVTAEYPAPFNVSWTEPLPSEEKLDHLVGLSEGEESGLIFTFDIDHGINTCEITRQQETLGAPAHCACRPACSYFGALMERSAALVRSVRVCGRYCTTFFPTH